MHLNQEELQEKVLVQTSRHGCHICPRLMPSPEAVLDAGAAFQGGHVHHSSQEGKCLQGSCKLRL
jgi:hypothetical protein